MTRPAPSEPADGRGPSGGAASRPGFAHASEAEFARILDFYEVTWRYEPHVFPILWSLEGEVLESFAPDFYLPELDLYVEMTTLRQKLVRKKNRKLRRLRELYPDVRIKLFYARDFRALMLKYGRVALADALSGSEGQFTPANPGPAAEPRRAAVPSRRAPGASPARPASPAHASPPAEPSRRPPLAPRAAAPSRSARTPAAPLSTMAPAAVVPAVPSAPGPHTETSASARPARRRSRLPAARVPRTPGRPGGTIGGDAPPPATTRDEGAPR